ncbi:hypothetical protein GCM10029976_094700 [Kribbella albertanoniae]|uniref:histidine kinase n=1 Tax=Kribbella albertanoniae TaxID=1266829 RepID=A0A4R4PNC7_9ACTN|nr:histidine kinase [Kribbella albertanoniae]TDC23727.1 hypothetical protein E1261_27760 [Kribbella albertanoniae]
MVTSKAGWTVVTLMAAAAGTPWVGLRSALGAGVCTAAGVAALVVVPVRRTLLGLTVGAAVTSILLTLLLGGPAGPAQGVAATVEAASLLLLIALSARLLNIFAAVVACTAGSLALAMLVLRSATGGARPENLGLGLFGVVLAAGAIAAGVAIRHRERARERLAAEARKAQRVELAKELHDFLGHDLSGILVQAQAARSVAGRNTDQQRVALRGIEEDALRALSTLEHTVRTLFGDGRRPALLSSQDADAGTRPTSGLRDLPALVRRYNDTGTPATRLTLAEGLIDHVDPKLGATVFRVVVEALTNVRRHARAATSVTVIVTCPPSGSGLSVEITDDGAGPPGRGAGRSSSGVGLAALRERVEAVGGVLVAGPLAESGWRLSGHFPDCAGHPGG